MTDIKDSEWYDEMRKKVKEILETLVMLDAVFVGYINVEILKQPITLSWTTDLVTVTADKYKWQMPIGWFISEDLIELIVSAPPSPATELVSGPPAAPEAAPAVAAGPSIPARVEAPVPAGDSLIVGGVKVPPGVKSVDEIMAEQGLDDADD